MDRSGLHHVVEDERVNAGLGWAVVGTLGLTGGTELLRGDLVWAGFVLAVAGLAIVPAVALRSRRAMLPWEVLVLAAVPLLVRALAPGGSAADLTFAGRIATYLSVAAVALVVAVELDVFTPVKMNDSFAVLFVTVATTAAAGVWAVVQWFADLALGTTFLLGRRPEAAVERGLMLDFVAATVAGVGAGLLFAFYFRRRRTGPERRAVAGGGSNVDGGSRDRKRGERR